MQTLIVALVVTGCCIYAAWVLMPSALRRSLAQRMQHWPWPGVLGKRVRRAALAPTGCGCDGCDAKPAAPKGGAQTIQIHRRPKG
jgi:hypothetical protein